MAHTAECRAAGEVMGSIDESGAVTRFVVADISRDDAWMSVPASRALSFAEWR